MRLRLFLGALVTSELRHHLRSQASSSLLQYTHYEGKEYLGLPLERVALSLTELEELEKQLKEQLLHHCPQLSAPSISLAIFAQTLVG